jgi:hypothetical protein
VLRARRVPHPKRVTENAPDSYPNLQRAQEGMPASGEMNSACNLRHGQRNAAIGQIVWHIQPEQPVARFEIHSPGRGIREP